MPASGTTAATNRETREPGKDRKPRRPAGLRRHLRICFIIAALILVLRLWWGHEAARRLSGEIASIRARGEPILLEDFAIDPVAGPGDAVTLYDRAGRAAVAIAQPAAPFDFTNSAKLPLKPGEISGAAALLDANPLILQDARAARNAPRRRVGVTMRPPLVTMLLPALSPARCLAEFLSWAAAYAHSQFDDSDTVEYARDLVRLGEAINDQGPFLVVYLVGSAIDGMACNVLIQVAWDLYVENDTAPPAPPASAVPATQPARPATRAQVRALIDQLLDDSVIRLSMQRAEQGERMFCLDEEAYFIDRTPAIGVALRPVWDLDTLRMLRRATQQVSAVTLANYPAAHAQPPMRSRAEGSRLFQLTRSFGRAMSSNLDVVVRRHYQRLAERGMVAVALASRLYRADHNGAWPTQLSDLVPGYLSAVPVDPFAADGRPLAYRANAPADAVAATQNGPVGLDPVVFASGPILYSVGENGTDEGGSRRVAGRVPPGADSYSDVLWIWDDAVLPLAVNPFILPPPPPAFPAPQSVEAENDQADQANHGGNENKDHPAQEQPERRQ